MVKVYGPRGALFLMSEVPLYVRAGLGERPCEPPSQDLSQLQHAADVRKPAVQGPEQAYRGTSLIKNMPFLEPYIRTLSRVLWWSQGGESVSYERGTPVLSKTASRMRFHAQCQVNR